MPERALLPIAEVREAMYIDEQNASLLYGAGVTDIRFANLRAVLAKEADPSTDLQAIAEEIAEFGPRFESLKDVKQTRALRAVLCGSNIKLACKAAGITYTTWYEWRKDPEFEAMYQAVLVARAQQQLEDVDDVERNLIDRAKTETDAAKVVLRAWKPERYRERQTIEVVSPDVVTRLERQAQTIIDVAKEVITGENISKYTPRELAALLASTTANKLREVWQ